MPPYVSTMILRPVRPQSPCGPPTTKRPVGLTWILVALSMSFFGSALSMTSSMIASRSCLYLTFSSCCVETTIASIANGHVVLVLEGDLRLAVGAEEVDGLLLPDRRELPRERVRVVNRRRHELGRLVGRVAEHEALVARPLLLVQARRPRSTPWAMSGLCRSTAVRTAQVFAVEAHRGVGVPDLLDRLAHDLREVDLRGRRDLAGDDDHPGLGERLARHAGARILLEDRVEDRVGHLVAELVRMPLGDGLGRETIAGHSASLLRLWLGPM